MDIVKSTLMAITLMVFLGLRPQPAFAVDKIIYGEDNRFDLIYSPLPLFNDLARSTAAMVKKDRLESWSHDDSVMNMSKNIKTLKKALNLCKDENRCL